MSYRYCRAVCRARVPTGIVGLYLEGVRARVPYRYCRAVFRGGAGLGCHTGIVGLYAGLGCLQVL